MNREAMDCEDARPRRRLVTGAIAVVILAATGTAAQAEWVHDVDAGEAAIVSDDHKLAVACSGPDDLTVYYAIPNGSIVDELVEEPPVILMVATRGNGTFQSYNASMVDYGARMGVGFRGPATRELARQFSAANAIAVGVALRDHAESFNQYNPTQFSGAGSAKAIKSLLEDCDIR